MGTIPQKYIEDYTSGNIIFETEEEVYKYLESKSTLSMDYKFLNN